MQADKITTILLLERSCEAVSRPIVNIASTFDTGRTNRLICPYIEIGDFTQINADGDILEETKETQEGAGKKGAFSNFKPKSKLQGSPESMVLG
jgi:hypothetical protein